MAAGATIQPQAKRPMNPYQNIQDLFKRMAPEIAKVLPQHIKSDHLLRVAMTEIRKNPKLLECSSQSLLGALMLSAQLGLEPGILGHAYLIPYYNNKTKSTEVQFQIGYKGYIDLVRRSGELQTLDVHEVCRNDVFEYEYGLTPKLMHRPALENRGAAYCYYAIAKFKDGGFSFLVMSVQDIEKFRKRSKSPDYGPWVTDYDAMAKKTVIKQLAKYLPLSTEIQRSMTQDETTKKEYEDVFAAADETDWVDITTTPAEPEPAVTE
ncbi:MAG TPA: recombination protein RecT [Thermotogota bacterium]|nr:recombination protein RecT [Thermotogota bacterium]